MNFLFIDNDGNGAHLKARARGVADGTEKWLPLAWGQCEWGSPTWLIGSVDLDSLLTGSQFLLCQKVAILPQEKLLKETQAPDCWSTHHILHLVPSLPIGTDPLHGANEFTPSEALVLMFE